MVSIIGGVWARIMFPFSIWGLDGVFPNSLAAGIVVYRNVSLRILPVERGSPNRVTSDCFPVLFWS